MQAEGKLEARDLVGARRVGQDWIAEKGFAAGELVIVEGTGKIRPGITQVKIAAAKPPAGGPSGSAKAGEGGAPKGPASGKAGG